MCLMLHGLVTESRIPSSLISNAIQYSLIRHASFQHFVNLKNVSLRGKGLHIKKLESYVFYKCRGLENIRLGEELEEIEDHAFEGCIGLKILELPKNLR